MKHKQRIISAIIFGVVVLAALLFNDKTTLILFGVVSAIVSFEYAKIIRENLKDGIFNVCFAAGFVPLFLGQFCPLDKDWFLILLIGGNVLFLLLAFGLITKIRLIQINHLSFLSPILYLGIPFFILGQFFISDEVYRFPFLLSIILYLWVSDSGAYFIGSKFGKNKLMPRISPNKTWEGFLGAGITTLAASFLFWYLWDNLSLINWCIFGAIIWISGTFGDLFESSIKRRYQIKDSGNIMPGHGGLLDRFDSFLFAIPFAAGYLLIISNLSI